ncbi:ankyrin repeat-containing protein [Colletotrichum sojae]|uniref:Ankyrin repeat-containing protein n=1 Tax=Colletotrichum sojae TaxID=2175907 RepID=A0A8H6IMT3_9PEZI|nr:ankyrin repeat-containing protein [Colletotrichum sojae]
MALVPTPSSATSPIPPTKELEDAVNEFRKVLTDDQRSELQKLKTIPDADAVLVFTAQLDRSTTQRNCPNKGTRLISILQFVRESSVIIDTFVSSHPEIAALVWGGVKLTIQVVLNFTSYYERVSDLFMQLAKDCPRFAEYQALFPNSAEVQKAICDFNASIIRCCKHMVEAVQRPWHTHLRNALLQSFQQEFSPDLESIRKRGLEAKQEIRLAKAKADHQDQRLQQIEREEASKGRRKVRELFSRLKNDLDTIKNDQLQQNIRQAEENRRQLLDSLSSHDHLTPYKKACGLRHRGTGEWLLRSSTFTQWETGTSSPWLWCSGKIGSGKTILTARAIEHVYTHEDRADETVTFFFPQFNDSASLSAETALRSIIRQSIDPLRLSSQWETSLRELDRKPSSGIDQLTDLLNQRINQSGVFYVFIDALDEFQPTERRALFKSLASLITGSRLRVFLASRENLSDELREKIPNIGIVSMASTETSNDIATFVEETLEERQRNKDLRVREQSIIAEVRQALVNHADGMFLWVTFLMDEICAQHSDDDIRSAIRCLPKNLTETFTRALQRITKRGYSSVANAKKAFQWIAVAKRNLALNELHEAMSIKIGQQGSRPGQLINDIDQLSTWCENLVRIDEETKTVEFAHQAIHTFIVEGLSSPYLTEFLFDLKKADHDAGEISVTYLNFSEFVTTLTRRSQPIKVNPAGMAYSAIKNSWKLPKSISNAITTKRKNVQAESDLDKMLATHHRSNDEEAITKLQDQHPFLKYASVHWISHTTRFTRRTSSTWSLWRQVVTQGHGLAKIPWSIGKEPRALNSNILSWSFANRHYAVIRLLGSLGKIHYAGKDEALRSSASEGDIDFVDALLESNFGAEILSIALQAASGGSHIEVVERLLDAGAKVNADPARDDGRTALQAASGGGHVEVVERLLDAGANVNADPAGEHGRTALQAASEGGHVEVVERLLDAGANVNADPAIWHGRTALQAASEGGHVEVVERLLDAGAKVNADPAERHGRTALQAASEGGHVEVVGRLLDAGANVNADPARDDGRTALQAASEDGHVEVVERLLDAGANVNADPAIWHGRTALQAASEGGHVEVVERLLDTGANVNADPAGDYRRTALQAASEGGHDKVVERLLDAGANVNADPAGEHGCTALQAELEGGHVEVVERLLAAGACESR